MKDFLSGIKKDINPYITKETNYVQTEYFAKASREYKKQIAGRFVLVEGSKITEKIKGKDICVTKKIDGVMQTIFFNGNECCMFSTNGIERRNLLCLEQMSTLLKNAGIKYAAIAAELSVFSNDGKRTRVSDVIHALGSSLLSDTLILCPFDIISLDRVVREAENYNSTYEKLEEIFSTSLAEYKNVQVVTMKKASSSFEVAEIYRQWVEEEKAEGLVVHSEAEVVWKVKPRHTIDSVAIGYTSGCNERSDMVRDILFAVREQNGSYRIFACGSAGLSDEERTRIKMLFDMNISESKYITTDSRNIPYQMIKPKFVFEICAVDFSAQNSMDIPYKNDIVLYSDDKGWVMSEKKNGVATYSLTIIRRREDKDIQIDSVRVSQISDICPFVPDDEFATRKYAEEIITKPVEILE